MREWEYIPAGFALLSEHCNCKTNAMEPTNLVLLGDSTGSRASVQALVRHSKTSAGARRLLQEATDLVQLYINRFSKDDGTWDHDARTLMELTDESNAAIAAITTCVAQLGDLIVYHSSPTMYRRAPLIRRQLR